MGNDEFVAWCEKYNLNPVKAARVLGCSRSSVFRYLADGPISEQIANQCLLFDMLSATAQARWIHTKTAPAK